MKDLVFEQATRIIENVFQHEESIDPRTIVLMLELIGRLQLNNSIVNEEEP